MLVLVYACDRCGSDLTDKHFALQVYTAERPNGLGAVEAQGEPMWLCPSCYHELNGLVGRWLDGRPVESTSAPPRLGRPAEVIHR